MLRSSCNFFNRFEILWIVNASVLLICSLLRSSKGQGIELIPYYLGYLIVYFLISLLMDKKVFEEQPFPIGRGAFFIATFLIMGSEPLFENDHYRYIWEGRTIWYGHNPYLEAPKQITDIPFLFKSFIGYPELSSIYPPLSLLFLAAVSWLPFKAALSSLMFLNALMTWFLLNSLWKRRPSLSFLLLMIPFLQKEFIQSAHIDLLAVFTLFLFGFKSKTEFLSKKNWLKNIILSCYTKLIGVLIAPILLLKEYPRARKGMIRKLLLLLTWLTPLFCFYFYLYFMRENSGVENFGNLWVWCPGFFSILHRIIGLSSETSRILSLGSFALFYSFLHLFIFKSRLAFSEEEWSDCISLIFTSLMFFSPVVNSWYFIWIVPFAWLANNWWAMAYVLFSQFIYLPHFDISLAIYAEVVVHALATIVIGRFIYRYVVKRSVNKSHRLEVA